MYAAGYLALAAWELAKEEADLPELLGEALPEVGARESTDNPAIESWLRAMDHRTAQLAGLLALLHPVVVHTSPKKGP